MDIEETCERCVNRISPERTYSPHRDTWFYWDGDAWRTDVGESRIYQAVAALGVKGLTHHQCLTIIETLERMQSCQTPIDQFDSHPLLFACKGRTIELDLSFACKPNPCWRLTKLSPVEPCDRRPTLAWDAFFSWLNDHNPERIEAMYRLLGYFLTGSVREQQVYFLYGPGRNGKTVLLELVKHLMGDYAVSVSPTLLVRDQHGSRHPTELMTLCGARLGIMSEVSPGSKLDVAKMKYLTGGDTINARSMRQDEVNFTNTCKLIAAVNDLPEIEIGAGHAEKRRIVIIPCANIVPEADVDRVLLDRLKAESPGILDKIIGGAKRYLEGGITWTQDILDATAELWSENNDLEEFVGRETEAGLELRVCKSEFYQRYASYRFNSGMEKVSAQFVSQAMKKLGFKDMASNGKRYWKNLGLKLLDTEIQRW